jgi:hypothetical protein
VDKDLKQICKRCAIPCGAELAQLQARQRLFAEEIGISFAILCERDNLSGYNRNTSLGRPRKMQTDVLHDLRTVLVHKQLAP